MLPPGPPKLSGRDFDPATVNLEEDIDMDNDEEEGSTVELSSIEINILIYLYLLESNFPHTAFSLLSESNLPSTSLFQHFHPSYPTSSSASRGQQPNGVAGPPKGKGVSPVTASFGRVDGKIPRGELIRKLWKGLRWEEIERHINPSGEPYKPQCPSPFHLLIPHLCPTSYPSSINNPPESAAFQPPRDISPPPRRSETFPAPSEAEAGPSRLRPPSRSDGKPNSSDSLRVQDLNRRQSSDSGSRGVSPAKSTASGRDKDGERRRDRDRDGKRRSKMNEDNPNGDDEPAKKGRPRRGAGENEEMDIDADQDSRKSKLKNGLKVDSNASNHGSREDSPIDKKRKRDDLLQPPNNRESDRRSKSPLNSGTPSKRNKELPVVETKKPKRGAGNPIWIDDDLIMTSFEHKDAVNCLSWNPKNPNILATGSVDGTSRIWELESSNSTPNSGVLKSKGNPITMRNMSIDSSRKSVTALDWHPEGSLLATASADGVGRLFTPNGQIQGIMSYGRGRMNAIYFSPSGQSILTAKDDFSISLFRISKGYSQTLEKSYEAHSKEVNDIAWLDEQTFASASNDRNIFIFRTTDKHVRFTFKGHTDDVTRIAWSPALSTSSSTSSLPPPPESRYLASVSDDGYLNIWKMPYYPNDRRTGSRSASPTKNSSKDEEQDYFDGSSNGSNLENLVVRWQVISEENTRMHLLEWSPACKEGRMLVAAAGEDSTVKIYDVESKQHLHSLQGLESGVRSLTFSPLILPGFKLGAIAGAGWSGQLYIWDVETGEKKGEWEVEGAAKAKNTPTMLVMHWRDDGKQLAIGLQNKALITIATNGLGEVKAESNA